MNYYALLLEDQYEKLAKYEKLDPNLHHLLSTDVPTLFKNLPIIEPDLTESIQLFVTAYEEVACIPIMAKLYG